MSVTEENSGRKQVIECNDLESVVKCLNDVKDQSTELFSSIGARLKVIEEKLGVKKLHFEEGHQVLYYVQIKLHMVVMMRKRISQMELQVPLIQRVM